MSDGVVYSLALYAARSLGLSLLGGWNSLMSRRQVGTNDSVTPSASDGGAGASIIDRTRARECSEWHEPSSTAFERGIQTYPAGSSDTGLIAGACEIIQDDENFPPNMRGNVRLGYVFASPLVQLNARGRKEKMGLLSTDKDLAMVREKLRASDRQVFFRANVATRSNFRELLNSGCRMLHFSGHGSEGCLAFESDEDQSCGVMEPLEVNRLKGLFQAGGVTTELAFISSCSSELCGNAFVEAGVPHVVAVKVQEKVSDQGAQEFSGAFYHALVVGRFSVKNAFDIAFQTVGSPLGQNFLLLPEGGNHDVKIFDSLPVGAFVDETPPLPSMVRCPSARRLYLGTTALQKVVEMLVNPSTSCLTIIGEHGSGKTERAIQACTYLQKRRGFDAIFFADCGKAVVDPTAVVVMSPCNMIGLALGMPQPGPSSQEELTNFLFTHNVKSGDRAPEKVLLVLDGVDAFFEDGPSGARDSVVELLSSICCSRGYIRLLVTSEHSILRHTNKRFRNGSEKVHLVMPLKPPDAAQLLADLSPRRFMFSELGIPEGSSRESIASASENHPVMEDLEGHPGTMSRLAPLLNDQYLDDPCVKEMAAKYRMEFKQESQQGARRTQTRPTSLTAVPQVSMLMLEQVDTPRYACFLPPWDFELPYFLSEEEQNPAAWKKRLKEWRDSGFKGNRFTQNLRLFFVCAQTHRLVSCGDKGQGYEVRYVHKWVTAAVDWMCQEVEGAEYMFKKGLEMLKTTECPPQQLTTVNNDAGAQAVEAVLSALEDSLFEEREGGGGQREVPLMPTTWVAVVSRSGSSRETGTNRYGYL